MTFTLDSLKNDNAKTWTKGQVERAFGDFCEPYLIPSKQSVYAGKKEPKVNFEASGVMFTYLAKSNEVLKIQARNTLKFSTSFEVLEYLKAQLKMKRQDPSYKG